MALLLSTGATVFSALNHGFSTEREERIRNIFSKTLEELVEMEVTSVTGVEHDGLETPAGLASDLISEMRNETIPFLLITSKVVLRQIQSAPALLLSRPRPCQPTRGKVQPRQEIFSSSLAAHWTMG
jgi:hypothetical protein